MNQFFGEFSSFSWEKYGQFGDSFGFVTAVFAGAAFFLLLKTYKAQKEELRATRQIMADQKSVMDKQKIETTFFNTLNLYSNAVSNFYLYKGRDRDGYRGVQGLALVAEYLADISKIITRSASDKEKIDQIYGKRWFWGLNRYYRIFAFLIEFCDSEFSSSDEAQKYTEIAFAHISDTEVAVFALYLIRERDNDRRKLLADYFFQKGLCKPFIHREIIEWAANLHAPKI